MSQYDRYPVYKLQSECKRQGLSTTGTKDQLLSALRDPRPRKFTRRPTPDFKAYATEPKDYLDKMEYELQEICNERDLSTDGVKHLLTERLLEADMELWKKANPEKDYTTASDPGFRKRIAYVNARAKFTEMHHDVEEKARDKYHHDDKVKIDTKRDANKETSRAALAKLTALKMAEEKLQDSLSKGTAADTRLDDAAEPLGSDSDFEELSDHHQWSKAVKNRENHSSNQSHNSEGEKTLDKGASSTLGASVAARDSGVPSTPTTERVEYNASATPTSTGSKTSLPSATKHELATQSLESAKRVKLDSSSEKASNQVVSGLKSVSKPVDSHAALVARRTAWLNQRNQELKEASARAKAEAQGGRHEPTDPAPSLPILSGFSRSSLKNSMEGHNHTLLKDKDTDTRSKKRY